MPVFGMGCGGIISYGTLDLLFGYCANSRTAGQQIFPLIIDGGVSFRGRGIGYHCRVCPVCRPAYVRAGTDRHFCVYLSSIGTAVLLKNGKNTGRGLV